ncbi:MAG: amidohydrolase family protein [Meiothermus sp.]|uniref:amidohydrolase family protein n=1 Tax=Meiothermus sp. TaxID=1955249 RepID=UPI002605999D|nr:amidohydrolase family protein [Meiothermus sp.]MCS7058122.1 amidohydrolase family protein [Meiothermus sp.]
MVVDAHQHFLFPSRVHYPWMADPALAPLRRDFTPDDLRPWLEACGVERTILVQARSSLEETRELLRIAAEVGFVAGVVGWVDLRDPGLERVLDELMALPEGRYLVGLRHQVHDEPDPNWLLLPEVQRGLAVVAERGLVYDLLVRTRELPAALAAVRRFPDLRFVLDHLAKPNIAQKQWDGWIDRLEPLADQPNLWAKLSGLVTEADWGRWRPEDLAPYIHKALELFGPERCMFGSDWPVCTLAADYRQVKEALELALSEPNPGVMGENAARVYRLPT